MSTSMFISSVWILTVCLYNPSPSSQVQSLCTKLTQTLDDRSVSSFQVQIRLWTLSRSIRFRLNSSFYIIFAMFVTGSITYWHTNATFTHQCQRGW